MPSASSGGEISVSAMGDFVKQRWPFLVIGVLLIFAAALRAYHADYPVIGYHNWKEVHYLTEARNFAREGLFAHGFFVPAFDYPDPNHDLSGAHSDSFPTISIIVAVLFKLLGDSLLVARWVGILFNLGAILYAYLLIRQLFKREDLALTTAAVMAINPLLVFFSRNVQLESPALFFMMAAAYYGAKWHEHEGKHQLLLGAAMLMAAVLTRYDYIIIAFPLLAIFPWRRAKQLILHPDVRVWWAVGALVLCAIPLWFWYSNFYLPEVLPGEQGGAVYSGIIDFSKPFDPELWANLKPYIADNFTFTGLAFAIFGLSAFLALYRKGGTGNRFMLGYLLGTLPWFLIMADKLSGHSYHMFPLVPLFAFLMAYGFTVVGSTIERFIHWRAAHVIVVILLLVWLWVPSAKAANRQFDTQFYGLDIAGEYIRTHSAPNERVFHSSHQNYGVLWHADRKGFKNPGTVAELDLGEQYNASWVFLYQWGFRLMENEEVWNAIKARYHPVQFAFIQNGQQIQPYYLLLRKGGNFDEAQLGEALQREQVQERAYELSGDNRFTLRYVNLE